jgi:hypothetical protein
MVMVLPFVPSLAEAGYAALAVGGGAAAGYLYNQAAQDIRNASKEESTATATVNCWKCDDQTCKALRKKVDGNHEELRKRTKDLVEDKQNLPYRAAGDVAKPSLSIWGHEQLYLQHQEQLREALQEYQKERCGPVRAGAYRRATQGIPKKGQVGFLD